MVIAVGLICYKINRCGSRPLLFFLPHSSRLTGFINHLASSSVAHNPIGAISSALSKMLSKVTSLFFLSTILGSVLAAPMPLANLSHDDLVKRVSAFIDIRLFLHEYTNRL
jgi:hypothetical protein